MGIFTVPSFCWKFSTRATSVRVTTAVELSVWTRAVGAFCFSLYLMRSLRAWKSVMLLAEPISL